ncbi:MAG: hypothetical protein QF412_01910, partial [Planctomycetota bacterium]|nr:hypothetical protein [Planctomycetota bacterium]
MRRIPALVVLSVLFTLAQDRSVGSVMGAPRHEAQSRSAVEDKARAQDLLTGLSSPFIPNMGQWDHAAKFVHRSGAMTVFLEERGWTLDLVERVSEPKNKLREPGLSDRQRATRGKADEISRAVALQMTFEGDANRPEMVGEQKMPGHHNYFLGNDAKRWRTDVPLYRVYRYGELERETADIRDLWQDDFVGFVLGCSYSFEAALL